MNISKKKILISTHSLIDFAGAEINVLSIARELKKWGNIVHVGAFQIDYPILEYFQRDKIPVINLLYGELISNEYDLIWSQHAATLTHIIFQREIKSERVIFSSLSPFEPFEAPPVYANELTLCLANSDETRDKLITELVDENQIIVFRNFAPSDFLITDKKKLSEDLRSICVVSNHLSKEVEDLKVIAYSNGITLDVYGLKHKRQYITPEILSNYDAVISIGKTVQYALVLGIPVFCYDIHGGPGWINLKNYERAKYYNFSGRGFDQKFNGSELFKFLTEGYKDTIANVDELYIRSRSEFNLTENLKDLFSSNQYNKKVDINKLCSNYQYLRRPHKSFLGQYEYNILYRKQLSKLENELSENQKLMEEKKQHMTKQIQDLNNEINRLTSWGQQYKELFHNLEKVNSELVVKLEQINSELTKFRSSMEVELKRKEENCQYLSQLAEEKNRKLLEMEATRSWRYLEKTRRIRNKLIKVIDEPSLIVRKLKKIIKKDYSVNVTVEHFIASNDKEGKLPLVSVVIPIYDRTDVLIQSIESILNQTYEQIELILVCDGSPEETLNIVKHYEQYDKVRAFYFNNNSGNAVRGRNKAILEAKGKYLAFQDSDDIAEPERIAISVQYMEKNQVHVVYGGWRALIDGSRQVDLLDQQEVFSPDCDYEFLRQICVPCQSTVMVSIDALRFVGGLKPKMKYREDHELWLRLAYYGYKFKAIDRVLTNLRLHGNNLELSFKENDDKWEKLTLSEHTIIEPLRPKIAYLIAGTGISGGLAVICTHANALLERGYDVLIISEDGNLSIDWYPNQRVQVISITEIPDNLDIVVATYWTTAYTLQKIPAKQKFYFVQSDESKFFDVGSNEYKAAINTYKMDYKYITMAKWLQDWLKKDFNKDATYVPNGVDLKVVYPVYPILEKKNKIRILIEGPIDVPFKGVREAFQVIKGLDCEVWCVSSSGTPDPDWKIDKYFEKVPFGKMKDIYSSCDILLKMSKIESFCLPALEMMACGGVCVLNRFNGIDEFVINGYNALVVNQGDIDGAREAIIKLMNDKVFMEQLSQNALETAQQWGWNRSFDILEQVYYSKNSSICPI